MRYLEDFNVKDFKALRRARGLTQIRLAYLSGVSTSIISNWEKKHRTPRAKTLARVMDILKSERLPTEPKYAPLQRSNPKPLPKPKVVSFMEGHCYSIRDSSNGGRADIIRLNPVSGAYCVFRYEGKEGVHHKFRETRGNWTRTYTDAQLIGKVIEEVLVGRSWHDNSD